jgi:hypothetical protein
MGQLQDFIASPSQSIERERLLHLTIAREFKLHAAIHGARLMITEPELDIEGFDFSISSEFESVYIQSKGTMTRSGRESWQIRAALLKPSFYNRDLMPDLDGCKVGGYATGATGGVLLHIIDEDAAARDRLEITYRYLDIYWLVAVASGIAGRPPPARERALALLRDMRDADDAGHISLRRGDFAKLNSVTAIATLRLHIGGMSNWASTCHTDADLAALHDLDGDSRLLLWPGVKALHD